MNTSVRQRIKESSLFNSGDSFNASTMAVFVGSTMKGVHAAMRYLIEQGEAVVAKETAHGTTYRKKLFNELLSRNWVSYTPEKGVDYETPRGHTY